RVIRQPPPESLTAGAADRWTALIDTLLPIRRRRLRAGAVAAAVAVGAVAVGATVLTGRQGAEGAGARGDWRGGSWSCCRVDGLQAAEDEQAVGDRGRCHQNFTDRVLSKLFVVRTRLDDEDVAVLARAVKLAVGGDR